MPTDNDQAFNEKSNFIAEGEYINTFDKTQDVFISKEGADLFSARSNKGTIFFTFHGTKSQTMKEAVSDIYTLCQSKNKKE